MQSIIHEGNECFICHRRDCLEWHHIFGAYNRNHSEEDGLKVRLCHYCHNEKGGVHYDKNLMQAMHELGQKKYEETHTRKEFMERYGKNYL